jgi:hypothetical protein
MADDARTDRSDVLQQVLAAAYESLTPTAQAAPGPRQGRGLLRAAQRRERTVTTALKNVHLTPASGNRKTGPIPVSSRPDDTCPRDCPFLPTGPTGGCYGTGYLFGSARKYSTDTTVEAATEKLKKGVLKSARYLRDRVVGDVVAPDGAVDTAYITGIAAVAKANDLIPFGYTHAWDRFTPEDIQLLDQVGYVMNASTETLTDAARAIRLGLPPSSSTTTPPTAPWSPASGSSPAPPRPATVSPVRAAGCAPNP